MRQRTATSVRFGLVINGDSMEIIRFECACGKRIRVAAKFGGHQGKCPACGNSFIVPNPPKPNEEKQQTAMAQEDQGGAMVATTDASSRSEFPSGAQTDEMSARRRTIRLSMSRSCRSPTSRWT